MDKMTPGLEQLLKAKHDRRRRLAWLPYAEKVRILVQLQRMALPLSAKRNPRACVWRIEP
jgi:hypothetical protein